MPPPGFVKVDVNGSYLYHSESTAIGGIVRDDAGNFMKGFYAKIGRGNALVAEFMALIRGVS